MTLNAAKKRLNQECEFLGCDWDRLMYLLNTNPMIFPQGVNDAYVSYLKTDEGRNYWCENA